MKRTLSSPPELRAARNQGFTTIELIMTLVVIAILSALAVPAMREFNVRANVSSTTNDLVVALNLARSEAVKRGRDVAVIAAGGDWSDGWIVQQVGDAATLSSRAAVEPGYEILSASTGTDAPVDRVVFSATGALRLATTFDFSVCRPAADADSTQSRRVAVSGSGSIRSHRDASASPAGDCL